MLRSAFAGTVKPDAVYLVDQADPNTRVDRLVKPLAEIPNGVPRQIIDLGHKRGCEGSAVNWYLTRVHEERVIVHEDVTFGRDSLKRFVEGAGDFLIDDMMGVITYRNRCAELIGLYDPVISPNSFRYVDVDYEDRLAEVGIHPTVVYCGFKHVQNGTMKGYSRGTIAEYHRLEEIARVNYEAKWGRVVTPGGNTIGRGVWRQQHPSGK